MTIRDLVFEKAVGRCQCKNINCFHSGQVCNLKLETDWVLVDKSPDAPVFVNDLMAVCKNCSEYEGHLLKLNEN